jgi:hypothetical protein
MNRKGQASTEIVLMLPLFLLLAAGALSIGYICWQGLKVQQAANIAARIQGQQRVSGGVSTTKIDEENGVGSGQEDRDITDEQVAQLGQNPTGVNAFRMGGNPRGVYGDFRAIVQSMFNADERTKLLVPAPKRGMNSDKVKVIRVLNPPKLLGLQMKPIKLEAEAYGGEDPRMFGLPRWGGTGDQPNTPFYQDQIQ